MGNRAEAGGIGWPRVGESAGAGSNTRSLKKLSKDPSRQAWLRREQGHHSPNPRNHKTIRNYKPAFPNPLPPRPAPPLSPGRTLSQHAKQVRPKIHILNKQKLSLQGNGNEIALAQQSAAPCSRMLAPVQQNPGPQSPEPRVQASWTREGQAFCYVLLLPGGGHKDFRAPRSGAKQWSQSDNYLLHFRHICRP